MGAVDHLMRASKGDTAQLQADAAAYGVILEAHHTIPQGYALWAEHVAVVDLFARCMTQWRPGPNGVVGMDYGVVLAMAKLYQVDDMPKVMEDLQVMELHARERINKQAQRNR
jgi:hypothetical protein